MSGLQPKSISDPLREAERSIGIALSRLNDRGVGGIRGWVGSIRDYKRIARLMIKTRSLADSVAQAEMSAAAWQKRRSNNE